MENIAHPGWPSQLKRSSPRTSFTNPGVTLNMKYQSWAAITVGMTHGTRMAALVTPRPLKVWRMIKANPSPMANSAATDVTVNIIVACTASQNRGSVRASV